MDVAQGRLVSNGGLVVHSSVAEVRRVFRYFDGEHHAQALCDGRVWVTTLATCRNHEREDSRDDMDGMRDYRSGLISGDSDDPANAIRLERLGIKMRFKSSTLINFQTRQVHPDAYVLCTTLLPNAAGRNGFGRFGVEIRQPARFFRRLFYAIAMERPVAGMFSRVTYAEPAYADFDPEPGPLGFTKRPDRWAVEEEARMLFEPMKQVPIEPREFSCQAASSLCRRIG